MVNLKSIAIIGAALVFLGLFTQEAAGKGLTGTLQRTGLAGSSIGKGALDIGTGFGRGTAEIFRGLLSPFWEIKNIIEGFMSIGNPLHISGTQGTGQGTLTNTGGGLVSNQQGGGIDQSFGYQTSPQGFDYYINPSISPNPVTDVVVHGQNLPLSVEAINWYKDLGVSVTPATIQDVEVVSGGGSNITTGQGASSGSNNPLSAAHAAGYSLGSA
jgi:hypothetical protein